MIVASVLDASAMLAQLFGETGAGTVEGWIRRGVAISAVNWSEVLDRVARDGHAPALVERIYRDQGLFDWKIHVVPFTKEDGDLVGGFRDDMRRRDVSLADCAALALARRLDLPLVCSDGAMHAAAAVVGVESRPFRSKRSRG